MSQIVAYNRRIHQRALLLAMVVLAVIAWMLAMIACMLALAPAAGAGEWVQRSCSVGTEYIFPEGWEGKANSGYSSLPNDNCERFYSGGGLRVDAAPVEGHEPLAGQTWTYKPPHGSTIAGGALTVYMTAREGLAQIAATVKSNFVSLAKCESPGCFHYLGDVPITAVGASEIYEQAACFPREGICHTPEGAFLKEGDGVFSAEAEISSAQVLLSTNATPAGSGLSGTLLNNTVTGKGTLSFTATDAGPGVYQARANIDGQRVWAATPNLNEGKCVSTGTSESARAFNYAQPCPTEAAVHTEIDTSGLTDGAHALTVEVEDAAGNTATVYSGTITILNHPPPPRGPANGTPASESATLTASWSGRFRHGESASAGTLTSRYGRAHEISGRLTNTAGVPIADALIEANQKPSSLGAVASSLASTHTATNGSFTISVPRTISSTSIQLAYRSHLGDAQPAATHTLTLQVPASIHLKISPRVTSVGRTIILSGKLAGPIPPGGKQVLFEAHAVGSGASWIEFHNATVDAHGHFRATHRFTFPGPAHYHFRVVCVREADFPFLTGISNVVRVRER